MRDRIELVFRFSLALVSMYHMRYLTSYFVISTKGPVGPTPARDTPLGEDEEEEEEEEEEDEEEETEEVQKEESKKDTTEDTEMEKSSASIVESSRVEEILKEKESDQV